MEYIGTDMGNIRQPIEEVYRDLTVSLNVVFLLTVVFALRFIPLPVSIETIAWLFVAQADPSPAWVLAPLLHQGIVHLTANIGQLLYFGIIPERKLQTREYIVFLAITGILSIMIEVVRYNIREIEGGMAGASGATMAVMGFAVASIGLYYLGYTENPGISDRGNLRISLFLFGLYWIIVQLFSDFYPGWTLSPSASGVAHLLGIILGAGYAVLKAR
ncbi:rhomboid family intramembrane serine protease [Natronomonas sp.]|uniref:rhomboid family intramembrane serine protease n=1 Tax=Natronomonas sp. TaxID=2184060 RepID=UPI0039757142